ncbi:MAG: type I-U CRISPR-associated protein Csb2 [Bacteroidota bacterium]|nr:type I-U CRISPR-associated protein Csb2 [Bacteroidota bacterium]
MSSDLISRLESEPRVLIEARLRPVAGTRFQPTGFPDIGPALYENPDGERFLLVESAQSMANRLEAVCWDEAAGDLVPELRGLPYVSVTIEGLGEPQHTSSLQEFHRLNSPYILDARTAEKKDFEEVLKSELGISVNKKKDNEKEEDNEKEIAGVVNLRRLAQVCFKYDPNSLIHGIFLVKIAGRLRHPRALSAFIEAEGVGRADSGGVKFDRVLPNPKIAGVDAKTGYGNVPFHRTEFTARSISAFFSLDLAQIRGYGLPPEPESLLVALSLWKVRAFLDSPLRLRTACELELGDGPSSIVVKRPDGFSLPDKEELTDLIRGLISKCENYFALPPKTVLVWEKKEAMEKNRTKKRTRIMNEEHPMPVTIKILFPAGRYHATPWGKHVNEGVPEWPPHPWRLLRSIIAVWRRTIPDIPEDKIRDILEHLCNLPIYYIPEYRVAHTRHYMPWYKKQQTICSSPSFSLLKYDNKKNTNVEEGGEENDKSEKKTKKIKEFVDQTLIFDTFIAVRRDNPDNPDNRDNSLYIHWEKDDLTVEQRLVLGYILKNLSFLGRAESWVECSLVEKVPDVGHIVCRPAEPNDPDPIRVLCADPETCFGDKLYPKPKSGRKAKAKDMLFDCPRWHLCLDTTVIRDKRWNIIPGARWVEYTRPHEREFPERGTPASKHDVRRPTLARFVLDGPVLPLVTETVRVAEAFRRAAMSRFRRWCEANSDVAIPYRRVSPALERGPSERLAPSGEVHDEERFTYASPTLSGKDATGHSLVGHRHAYYLPVTDESDPHRLASVIVFARDGFTREECEALASVSEIRMDAARGFRVRLVELGAAEDNEPRIVGPSQVWRSLTPYLGHECIGMRDRDKYLRKGLRREWRRFSEQVEAFQGAELVRLEMLTPEELDRMRFPQPWAYCRARVRNGGIEVYRAAGMFRLVFSRPVPGPLSLGYACHFGMGLFGAEVS